MSGLRLKVWISAPSLAVIAGISVAFLLLKLLGVLGWDWVWIVAPLWITMGLCLFLAAVLVVVGFLPISPAPGTRWWWVR